MTRWAAGAVAVASRGLLTFLEVIGLRREAPPEATAQLFRLRLLHTEFRTLLSANDGFLATVGDLERCLHGEDAFDATFIRRRAVRALTDVHRMVSSLDAISAGAYPALRPALDRVATGLHASLGDDAGAEPLTLELDALDASYADLAGGKLANLGEVRNVIGLPTPDGFVMTTAAYHRLLAQATSEGEPDPAAIRAAALPADVEAALLDGFDRLAARTGCRRVAVRSSALGEDSARSFAGQFLTLLNVDRAGLADAYRAVVASLLSAEPVQYRRLHGLAAAPAAMAVGVLPMLAAEASGVAYSRDPSSPVPRVLIHAVHGLGVTLAEGGSAAEAIIADGGADGALVRASLAQSSVTVAAAAGGVSELEPPPASSCLTDTEARRLIHWMLVLEAHFGCPQDVEWALEEGRLVLLQARPLRMPATASVAAAAAGATVLLAGGDPACAGVGAGIVVRLDEDGDLESFPAGAVLVARRSSPRFVRLMARTSAIVTDAGSVTGHMASLARELGIPALLNTRTATRELRPGTLVTVDSRAGRVYAGELPLEHEGQEVRHADEPGHPPRVRTRARALLERVAGQVVPLNLTDPQARDFTPEACRSLHDLARFVHERSYAEMFLLGERVGDLRGAAVQLDVFLPIDLYLVDLGGGLAEPPRARTVRPADVACVPLAALLRGMLDRRLPRCGPRAIDLGGLLSLMARHALRNAESERTFRDPCYALISETYLNYTARVGYHFGVVDCYCSPNPNRNYISFRFKGGAADRTRRRRRVQAIAGVLREKGFAVELAHDMVQARHGKDGREGIERQLEMLGRLLQYFRQMDVAMTSDAEAERFQDAFLREDFGYELQDEKPLSVER